MTKDNSWNLFFITQTFNINQDMEITVTICFRTKLESNQHRKLRFQLKEIR